MYYCIKHIVYWFVCHHPLPSLDKALPKSKYLVLCHLPIRDADHALAVVGPHEGRVAGVVKQGGRGKQTCS